MFILSLTVMKEKKKRASVQKNNWAELMMRFMTHDMTMSTDKLLINRDHILHLGVVLEGGSFLGTNQ